MYTWYFPKADKKRHDWQQVVVWLSSNASDATVTRVSYSQPKGYQVIDANKVSFGSGDNKVRPAVELAKIDGGFGLQGDTTAKGDRWDVISWDQFTQQAKDAFNDASHYGGNQAPISEEQFEKHIGAAFCGVDGDGCPQ